MASMWRKNTAARNMSGSALSPSCTSFLFLDQKIKAEGKELPHASHSRGLAASSALALWCSRRARGKPIPGRVPWHHPAPQLCQPQRLPRGAPRGPAAVPAAPKGCTGGPGAHCHAVLWPKRNGHCSGVASSGHPHGTELCAPSCNRGETFTVPTEGRITTL